MIMVRFEMDTWMQVGGEKRVREKRREGERREVEGERIYREMEGEGERR